LRHARLEQLLALKTFRIVACCRTVGDFYREQVRVPAEKVAVLYNAVRFTTEPVRQDHESARMRLGLPSDALVIGTLGRLTEQKGQLALLDAVAKLTPRIAKLALIVAGDGPLRGRLEERARDLGIAERVRFLGIRRDRDTLYAAMDAFVLPSRWEGLSLALVEAMGAGRAVVATDVGGNPEVVSHGKTGLLVPPGDASALADALATVLTDGQLAQSLGSAACSDARERFSIDRHVSRLAALYRQGVAERSGSRAARVGVGG
jgi:glycosyltransferase involved in cell wall biosynthesis